MNRNKFALACVAALSMGVSVVTGCAGDRPLRNGVPNENIFLRKAFIIRPGLASTPDKPVEDDGWFLKATVLETSTPNPLASTALWTGAENNGMLVRFKATQDKLQLVNIREISNSDVVAEQGTRTPEVVDAWHADHVDLKLAVTADGEKTNRFEMNEELDWKIRQWVKVNLAKTDLSDFSLFGLDTKFMLEKCAGHSMTAVVPSSILVDEANDYIEWKTNVTMGINVENPACLEAYGEAGQNFFRLGRQNVSATLKYSLVRAKPVQAISYKPLEIREKDPIKRKYGPILQTSFGRDLDTGLMAARQFAIRFDPEKEFVLYFAKGYPESRKGIFTDPGGIVDQTNAVFEKAGAKVRLVVKNYDQDIPEDADALTKERGREYGDIRYNFIRWMSDIDVGAPFIGVAQFVPDPRTGEALSASINIADFALKDFVAQRVDAFLSTIMCNASYTDSNPAVGHVCAGLNNDEPWGPPLRAGPDGKLVPYPEQCQTGQIAEIIPSVLHKSYGQSSLYSKMQGYLGMPAEQHGPLGPRDFVPERNPDFEHAFRQIIPYYVFADPQTNMFVTPVGNGGEFGSAEEFESFEREADFHKMTAELDTGVAPFAMDGDINKVTAFLDRFQKATLHHRDHKYRREYANHRGLKMMDGANDLISLTSVMEKAGRHCVDGRWETRDEWLAKLTLTYNALTVWHEFGHILGLDHNFMASVDAENYPRYRVPNCDPSKAGPEACERVGMYSSSVMEYAATPDRIFWANETGGHGWGPYDQGALGWLYSNETVSAETLKHADEEIAKKFKADRSQILVSRQVNATLPYNDPLGFREDGREINFLYCNANHMRFSPFCRQGDFGSRPSEIIANQIETYEWQYAWRNFRKYRKVWDLHNYADLPAQQIMELRRFMPMWRHDWQESHLRDDFLKIGLKLPSGANASQLYYDQLALGFNNELARTQMMVAAFHLATIQQSSGERPYRTIIDKYQGDVTQQGITLDKSFAMTGWVGLWPNDNYDPNYRGEFVSSFSSEDEPAYRALAEQAVANMIGEERFDAFPWLRVGAVVLFARDTHNINFDGRRSVKDWIGGQIFVRSDDVERYFREMARDRGKLLELGCDKIETCTYDPRKPRGAQVNAVHLSDRFNEFVGPDGNPWAWVEFQDRRQWLFVRKDRNTALYRLIRNYQENITQAQVNDDRAIAELNTIKYAIDSYLKYETFSNL
jgi:hypothetical protein